MQDLEKLQRSLKYCVLDIQSDWPAYLEVVGGRFWNHNSHPCALCRISQNDMTPDCVPSITLDNVGHELYSTEDYNNDIDNFTKVTKAEN